MFNRIIQISCITVLLSACGNEQEKPKLPIVLGDSSSIVTETDPQYLTDFFSDLQLQQLPEDTIVSVPADTAATGAGAVDSAVGAAKIVAIDGKGLSIPFDGVTIFIPGIEVKTYSEQNLEKSHGASYQLVTGDLKGNQIIISGGTVEKVSQRYITNVMVKNDLGVLILDALDNTSSWSPVKGQGGVYPIKGLEESELDYKKANPAQIRAAVSRAARNKRMSRKNLRKWEASVRDVKSVNQKPLMLVLRSVMWKIDGKDAKGKNFSKQIRIDMPAL